MFREQRMAHLRCQPRCHAPCSPSGPRPAYEPALVEGALHDHIVYTLHRPARQAGGKWGGLTESVAAVQGPCNQRSHMLDRTSTAVGNVRE
jgi:hypothetical protein